MKRLALTCYRRRRWAVALWLALLIGLNVLAASIGTVNRVDYTMPGSDSAQAQQLLTERFPDFAGGSVDLIVHDPKGVDRPATLAQLNDLEHEVEQLDHVQSLRTEGVSPDGTVALVVVQLDDTIEKVPTTAIEEIMDAAAETRADGLQVESGGFAVQNAEGAEAGSEGLGMVAALIILVIAFGAVVAAGLPIVVAIVGLGVSLSVITVLSHVLMVPEWGAGLATMIGLGVGIDYALFIVNRYRSALRSGHAPQEAVVIAMTTSGRAVLFAGCTVMIALFGLGAMGLEYLWATAVTTSVTVLMMLFATLTLLPALLGFMGTNVDRGKIPFVRGDTSGDSPMWTRWSHVVQRRPLITGAVALVLLLALAAPAIGLRFGYPDAGTGPEHLSSRRAYDLVTEGFGPGANGPLVVAVDAAGDTDVVERVQTALAADPGVAAVLPPEVADDGSAAMIVLPVSGPQEEATVDLIHHLRGDVVPDAVGSSAAEVTIGGSVASFVDESSFMSTRLPLFIGAVVLLSFLLLLVVFRSVLVALKAALMNLLAIGAAYGVMALALQGGWFGQLLGIDQPTPIPVWVPVMTFAMLFGLSMDYEVFLLSRIREEWQRTRDNATAVAHGLASTGRVITAAAAIMVTVFGAYIFEDQVLMKVVGLGLAVAVLVDATLVRMVLVPSTMELLGDRNWWLPGWLDRILPTIDLEGEAGAAVATDGVGEGRVVELDGPMDPEVDADEPAGTREPALAGR
ncbi:MAG: putative superfamily drug exporter [Ilumatobacteraceae bacterium]|nr:putative superfamily drug exporter [Ilumatobacteraceae bacterium]